EYIEYYNEPSERGGPPSVRAWIDSTFGVLVPEFAYDAHMPVEVQRDRRAGELRYLWHTGHQADLTGGFIEVPKMSDFFLDAELYLMSKEHGRNSDYSYYHFSAYMPGSKDIFYTFLGCSRNSLIIMEMVTKYAPSFNFKLITDLIYMERHD